MAACFLQFVPDKVFYKLRSIFFGLMIITAIAIEIPWVYLLASGLAKAIKSLS
ncbi:MAG: hypothetical protein WCO55_03885 [Candidatus Falkowbacteria bacterium]